MSQGDYAYGILRARMSIKARALREWAAELEDLGLDPKRVRELAEWLETAPREILETARGKGAELASRSV